MLSELVISPDVFEAKDEDFTRQLDELRHCLFPATTTAPIVICNLGKWTHAVMHRIALCNGTMQKKSAQDLFQKIHDQMLVRRRSSVSLSADEKAWVAAANQANREYELDGIITRADHHDELSHCLNRLTASDFFRNRKNPCHVGRECESQEKMLRALCLHSDWMILRLPYITGGVDDEIVTVKQILRLIGRATTRESVCEVTVQLRSSTHDQEILEKVLTNIRSELNSELNEKMSVTLEWIDENYLNREIIAGTFVYTGRNKGPRKRARWMLHMQHVAASKKSTRVAERNYWSLSGQSDAHQYLEYVQQIAVIKTERLDKPKC